VIHEAENAANPDYLRSINACNGAKPEVLLPVQLLLEQHLISRLLAE